VRGEKAKSFEFPEGQVHGDQSGESHECDKQRTSNGHRDGRIEGIGLGMTQALLCGLWT